MLAYKCLEAGRSQFTGWRWQLPSDGRPGPWHVVSGRPALCVNGVHACTPAQLPPWLGRDLWEVELDGDIVDEGTALVATRARLVRPVSAWDESAWSRFAADCAARAAERARGHDELQPLVRAIESFIPTGHSAAAGYWAAVVAGQLVAGRREGPAYDGASAAERADQANWLAHELQLG